MMYLEGDRLLKALRSLPRYSPPAYVSARLRIAASRERVRLMRRSSLKAWLGSIDERMSLFFQNLMKPFAVPVVGGLASAVILFAALAPNLIVQRHMSGDVPSTLATSPILQSSMSFGLSEQDIVVDLIIDDQGRVVDYSLPDTKTVVDPELLRGLQETLLYTKFVPAKLFGQPASGRTRITLRRSQLDVKG